MVNSSRVAIVVDSAISLPKKVTEEHGLYVVPMDVVFEGKTYRDGLDMETAEFYERMQESHKLPTTSAPSPASFLEVFRSASQNTNNILCLTLSSKFSRTYESARSAVELAAQSLSNVQISLVDTHTAAGAQALVALAAARSALEGSSVEKVRAVAQEVASRVSLVAFLDTLYYLWKGGRVPKVGLWIASILKIKPLLELSNGEVHMIERPRTRTRATERLLAIMRQRIKEERVHAAVIHAHSFEEAETLRACIASEFECDELFVSEFTPVLGAHTGPGLLGIAFWSD